MYLSLASTLGPFGIRNSESGNGLTSPSLARHPAIPPGADPPTAVGPSPGANYEAETASVFETQDSKNLGNVKSEEWGDPLLHPNFLIYKESLTMSRASPPQRSVGAPQV